MDGNFFGKLILTRNACDFKCYGTYILNYKWREISHLLNEMNGINQFQLKLNFKEIDREREIERERGIRQMPSHCKGARV